MSEQQKKYDYGVIVTGCANYPKFCDRCSRKNIWTCYCFKNKEEGQIP
jgi:hypothetical protein